MTIRLFLTVLASIVLSSEIGVASNVGKRYPSEKHVIVDRITGRPITVLTSSPFNDSKPSFSRRHSWTADGNWIIFDSNRGGNGTQVFAVNELTGDIVQLTDDIQVGAGRVNPSSKAMKVFYIRGQAENRQAVELNIGSLLADSMNDQVKEPTAYERVVASLPYNYGQLALDADETCLYWGGHGGPGTTSEIFTINIQTGNIDKLIDVAFQAGHFQANPWVSGELFFNKEPGSHPDQRIWSVKSDGTKFRPIYVETREEWVTHPAVTGPDEMMFIISGHMPSLRKRPSGVAVVNLRTDEMMILGQIPVERTGEIGITGGVWHCHGSSDGRWAVVDTFLGNIILIDRTTCEQILLSAGHPMRPDHAHPTFSRDGKRILIQSALLTDGKNLNLMVINVP